MPLQAGTASATVAVFTGTGNFPSPGIRVQVGAPALYYCHPGGITTALARTRTLNAASELPLPGALALALHCAVTATVTASASCDSDTGSL